MQRMVMLLNRPRDVLSVTSTVSSIDYAYLRTLKQSGAHQWHPFETPKQKEKEKEKGFELQFLSLQI